MAFRTRKVFGTFEKRGPGPFKSRLSLMSFFSYLHSFHFTLHMLCSRRRYALLGCFLNLVLLSFFLQIIVLISLENGSKTGKKLWNCGIDHTLGILLVNNC